MKPIFEGLGEKLKFYLIILQACMSYPKKMIIGGRSTGESALAQAEVLRYFAIHFNIRN